MTYSLAIILYLYVVGAAGFGAALINYNIAERQRPIGVVDMLLILCWPLSAALWLLAEFIREVRN